MKRRYFSMMLALGVAMSLFVGSIATSGAQSTNLPDGDEATGAYFPWVPYGHMLGDQGPFYGSVTVQNISGDAVDMFFFAGDPTGWGDPYVVNNVQSFAHTTASASQIGLEEPGGSVRVHAAPLDLVEWDDGEFVWVDDPDPEDDDVDAGDPVPADVLVGALQEVAGSVKNVSPQPASGSAGTNANHMTVDGYSGMTGGENGQVADGEHVLPIVQTNAGWNTQIKVANFDGGGNVNYNVTFYETGSGTGNPYAGDSFTVQAGDSKIHNLADFGIGEDWTGSAYVSANGTIGAVAERYKNIDDMLVTNVSRPTGFDGDFLNNSVAPLVFQDYNFWNTGISVANLDEGTWNDVQIDFYTPGGSLVGNQSFRIQPRSQRYIFVPGDQNLGLGGQVGAAIVRGTTDLHATVDQVKYLGDDEETGNAMSYVTNSLNEKIPFNGNMLSVPLVQKGNANTGGGDTSGVQFFNSNGTSEVFFELAFVTSTGNPADANPSQPLEFRLSSHQGATVYTHNYGSLGQGFTGSVVAQYVSGGGWLSAVSNNVNYDVNGDGSVAYQAIVVTGDIDDLWENNNNVSQLSTP